MVCALAAGQAHAAGPDATLRPSPRPVTEAAPAATDAADPAATIDSDITEVLRPVLRPDAAISVATAPTTRRIAPSAVLSALAPRATERPEVRPAAFATREAPPAAPVPAPAPAPQQSARGSICDDPAIIGEVIADIDGPGQCGVDGAVRVRSVAGVPLSEAATIDCTTARALRSWVTNGVVPAVGGTGGGVASLQIMGHYTCRNRVGAGGPARMSEHGMGRAVDIGAIRLQNGQEISVLRDWNNGSAGQALKAMWQAACGPFGTVLGPNANAAHRDHFHFDTARGRSSSYCR
ncbi:Uncharacterized conserved protein [Loktanella fryxellensis]|uniref:Uncharacterized conserved protein n=1 Tax=Loktanella fryxellensis TaxID=245187 RepID=A0A1H8G9I6_9RHOB|nr:extensin family protein [Loktanella fryxellensis]SEN40643.1 Uncharacterized conserved protein [Loktanella fryxellensis]